MYKRKPNYMTYRFKNNKKEHIIKLFYKVALKNEFRSRALLEVDLYNVMENARTRYEIEFKK